MDPVRRAMMRRLSEDAAITTLLADGAGGIWHRKAPLDAQAPLVIFDRVDSHDLQATFGGARWEDQLWLVKAIARDDVGSDASATGIVEDLSDAIDALLHDNALPVDGHIVLWLRREQRVEYGDPDGLVTWQHAGGLYRLKLEPA